MNDDLILCSHSTMTTNLTKVKKYMAGEGTERERGKERRELGGQYMRQLLSVCKMYEAQDRKESSVIRRSNYFYGKPVKSVERSDLDPFSQLHIPASIKIVIP